jgi:ATP-dependent 26S proteasome regulatory subunit
VTSGTFSRNRSKYQDESYSEEESESSESEDSEYSDGAYKKKKKKKNQKKKRSKQNSFSQPRRSSSRLQQSYESYENDEQQESYSTRTTRSRAAASHGDDYGRNHDENKTQNNYQEDNYFNNSQNDKNYPPTHTTSSRFTSNSNHFIDDASSESSHLSFGDQSSVNSDEYDEYLELLRHKNNGIKEPDSEDEQMIFKRINPTEFSAYPTVPPSTVNLLSEAVHGLLTSSNKESVLHNLASKLADLDPDPLPAKSRVGDKTSHDSNQADKDENPPKSQLSAQDIQNQTILHGWGQVGGHKGHLTVLHEMIILPLLYPEIFKTFNISPPRGVLFTGPPGTGKTLTARTLATIVQNISGKKVSFFVRKGADCLSKWVGEAERQLRLLFEQAKALQPSIIFFDEIDGLAPVRNSNQDHIHSSIVSTLLALMDGLDGRGEQVIVIGATNRIDSIDPALRRPGRFDRELTFSLPNQEERLDILKIHTQSWSTREEKKPRKTSTSTATKMVTMQDGVNDGLTDNTDGLENQASSRLETLLKSISHLTAGYSGADLQSLCTQASLACLRRSLPHLYSTSPVITANNSNVNTFITQMGANQAQMSQLLSKVTVLQQDFLTAMRSITPTQQRVFSKASSPLNNTLQLVYNNSKSHQNIQDFSTLGLIGDSETKSNFTENDSKNASISSITTAVNDDVSSCSCCSLCKPIMASGDDISAPNTKKISKTLYDQLRCYMHELLPLGATTLQDYSHERLLKPKNTHSTACQNKFFLINRLNLGQQPLVQSLLTEYEEIPIYTLSLSALHNLQNNYGTSSLYETVLTLFTGIKRDHFSGGLNTKYPTCIIHWPNVHQWYEYSYLRELIEIVLLSFSELSHIINSGNISLDNNDSAEYQPTEPTFINPMRGYLLLCDAEWDYFQIPAEILAIFHHPSAQGVIVDISHRHFHNLLYYPNSSFPIDQLRNEDDSCPTTSIMVDNAKKNNTNAPKIIPDLKPVTNNDLFALFSNSISESMKNPKEKAQTSNCSCVCSNVTQKRLSTILVNSLELFIKKYTSLLESEVQLSGRSTAIIATSNIGSDLKNTQGKIEPVKKKSKSMSAAPKQKLSQQLVQLPNTSDTAVISTDLPLGLDDIKNTTTGLGLEISPESTVDKIQVTSEKHKKNTSNQLITIEQSLLLDDNTGDLLDGGQLNPDDVYFSMREQRHREVILLHLRMFLRNIHSHLLAHFKDFVISRDDLPEINNNNSTKTNYNNDDIINYSDRLLTLTEILTRINTNFYFSIREYLSDIDFLVTQIKYRFNLSTDIGRVMIQRVCQLQDVALTLCLGFDLQIAAACELIAKELRLKQQIIYTKYLKLHKNSGSDTPPVPFRDVKVFGHIFQYESLLLVNDLKTQVQGYILRRQSDKLLQIQHRKVSELKPNFAGETMGDDDTSDGKANRNTNGPRFTDDKNQFGDNNQAKKRQLPNDDFHSLQNTDLIQSPNQNNQIVNQIDQRSKNDPNSPVLIQIHKIIDQLSIFSASIDIPTIESLHQQLMQCLSTQSVDSNEFYSTVPLQMLFVLKRFLAFACRHDELYSGGVFTKQLLEFTQKQNISE